MPDGLAILWIIPANLTPSHQGYPL